MTRSQLDRLPLTCSLVAWTAALSLAGGCAPPAADQSRGANSAGPSELQAWSDDPKSAGVEPAFPDLAPSDGQDPADDTEDDTGPGGVYPADLSIGDDAAADAFCAAGYTGIAGSLRMGEAVTSTVGLACLQSVGGALQIESAFGLASIEPFEDLTWIGGDLRVANLPHLQWADPFPVLQSIGGDLVIEALSATSGIDGLQALGSVGGRVAILDNGAAITITMAPNLRRVAGDVEIVWNRHARTVALLDALQVVRGSVIIEGMNAVESLYSMAGLERIEGDLHVIENDQLRDLDGALSIDRIEGDVRIERNRHLEPEAIQRFLSYGAEFVDGQILVSDNGA